MTLKDIPRQSRTERKKEQTKQKIIAVALKLFREKGFDGTTMEQIAEETDIAKGTLYNYFPVKEAILDEYIKQSFKEKNIERLRQLKELPDTRSRLIQAFTLLIHGIKTQKEIFEKYLVYRMQMMVSFQVDESERSGFNLLATELIRLGQESGEIRKDLPLYVLVELFEFAFIQAVKILYLKPETFYTGNVIERYVDLCLNGIKQDALAGSK